MFSYIISQLLLALVAAGLVQAFNSGDTWKAITPPNQVFLLYPNGTASLGPVEIGLMLNSTEAGTLRVPFDITLLSPSGVSQNFSHTFDCVRPTVWGDPEPPLNQNDHRLSLEGTLIENGTYTLIYNISFGTPAGPPTGVGSQSTFPCGTGPFAFQSFLVNATFAVDNIPTNANPAASHTVQLPTVPTGSGYIGQAPSTAANGEQSIERRSVGLSLALALIIVFIAV